MAELEKLAPLMIEFYEKFSSWEHSVVKESGLSPAQMHAIEIIGHEQSLRMKELAEKMGVTTGTLTVMVDRLERNGFLSRKPHEQDRRSYLVVLTDKGKEHFEQHHQFHLRLTEDISASLSPEEQKIFAAALTKIITHI